MSLQEKVNKMDALTEEVQALADKAERCFNPMEKMKIAGSAVEKSIELARLQGELIKGLING